MDEESGKTACLEETMKKFKGLYPALVTPYDRNGKVDDKKAQKLVEHLLDCGVDGFYIGRL